MIAGAGHAYRHPDSTAKRETETCGTLRTANFKQIQAEQPRPRFVSFCGGAACKLEAPKFRRAAVLMHAAATQAVTAGLFRPWASRLGNFPTPATASEKQLCNLNATQIRKNADVYVCFARNGSHYDNRGCEKWTRTLPEPNQTKHINILYHHI